MTVLSRNADLWKILYYPTITDFYRPMTPLLKQLSWGVEILPFFSVANEIDNPAYKNVSEKRTPYTSKAEFVKAFGYRKLKSTLCR